MSDQGPRYEPPVAKDLSTRNASGGPGPEGICYDGSAPAAHCMPTGFFPALPSVCNPVGSDVALDCLAGTGVA